MDAEAALQQIAEGLDALLAGGLDPADAAAAAELVRSVEVVARKMQAVQVAVVDVIDGAGLHRHDGHASAKVMVRHLAALSGGEATRRAQAAAVLRDLPETAAAHRAGELGTCQVRRLGRVHANRRVRDRMAGSESFLLTWARDESYRQFDLLVEQWERLVDEDGAGSRDHAHFERRDARMVRDYDGMWTFTAHCDSLTGVHIRDIFGHFTDTEFHTDWTQARRRVGDQVTVSDLARTDAQRRFDAFATMCHQAATTPPGGVEPLVVTNVVIDQASFERQLTRLAGGAVDAIDPHDPTHRCSTLDGEPLDPTTATVTSLLGHVRRVVTGADGVTVDMGRRRRLFTGPAHLAARLRATECIWPGCHVPSTHCQIDHLRPWADGGPTDAANSAPLCRRHNRLKHHDRYRTWRDPTGRWHTTRPDGTPIEAPCVEPGAGAVVGGVPSDLPVASPHDPR